MDTIPKHIIDFASIAARTTERYKNIPLTAPKTLTAAQDPAAHAP